METDCVECHACCLETPIIEYSFADYQKYKALWEYRGMICEELNGHYFVLSPRCRHLGKDGKCMIYHTRPAYCWEFNGDHPLCSQMRSIKKVRGVD